MQAWPAMDHISTEFGLITQAVLLLENITGTDATESFTHAAAIAAGLATE